MTAPETPAAGSAPMGDEATMSAGDQIEPEPDPAPDSAPDSAPDPALVAAAVASDAPTTPPVRRRRGVMATLRRLPHPPLRSKRAAFLIFVLLAGFGSMMTVGSVAALHWTETADFCGRCHTMGPELKAHALSAHRDIACAECHVEPGLAGWIKAKLNGTRQLVLVMTGGFSAPIPPPDHADLPPTSKTCVRCHNTEVLVEEGGPVKLVLHERFQQDETNSRDTVALVLRPAGFGGTTTTRGVHWHIAEKVEYISPEPRARSIDYVTYETRDGRAREYLASWAVTNSSNVEPDIERLAAEYPVRRMDCLDCHNRAGHSVPSPEEAIDDAMTAQRIDRTLPFIKREAHARLSQGYTTDQEADRAFEGIRAFYEGRYPLLAERRASAINGAIDELKRIYRLVATPDMQVTGTTYPDNLGHTASPGCFRCHDGAHYRVVNGALTNETIPSACATCHTFPQIGSTASGVLIGRRPTSHDDRLWVFDHKAEVSSLDPASTTCGECHTRTYCENCHQTEAVNVPHDDMVYNHAAVMDKVGGQACAYCHQPAYCAQCHADEVLPDPYGTAKGRFGSHPSVTGASP